MTNKQIITKIIKKINPPKSQKWVTLEDLLKAAKVLDDSKNRSNS